MKLPDINLKFDENKIYECLECGRIECGLVLRNLICLSDFRVGCRCDQSPLSMYRESLHRIEIK
jgi:hypothetical protein